MITTRARLTVTVSRLPGFVLSPFLLVRSLARSLATRTPTYSIRLPPSLTIPNWLPFLTTQSRMALDPMCALTTRSTLLTPSSAAAVELCSANTHASGRRVVEVG